LVATATANGSGIFTFDSGTYSQTLSNGNHTNITAKSFNSNGDASPDSNAITIFVDTDVPTTSYSTVPAAPDGNNGYFKTTIHYFNC